MAFVNVLLLFGILAVSIPIIIQLLTRRHTRKIMWGAMVFLQAAMNKRKRKVLLEDILLLACRCLLPALAALALARPFVTPGSRVPWVIVLPMMLLAITLFGISFAMWRYPKWRRLSMALSIVLAALSAAAVLLERRLNLSRFGGGANKDVALIVDGSSSMSMTGSDGKSNFENAIEEAGKYIEGASRGTAFSLILGGPVPEILTPVPVSDRRVLLDTLKRMRPSQGTMRAPPALAAAAVTLATGNNTVKQVIGAGDGQAVGWDLTSEGRWESIKALFGQLRTPPPVVWRTLPLPASIRNLAVSSVTLSREVVGADREVKVRVTVSNPGTEAVTPGGVSLSIGPKVLKAKDARQLEPGDSQTFEFPHTFEKPGAAVLTATVEAGDDLPEDDTFRLVVPVLDKLRVLVVDGDGSGSPLSRGSTYLSLALRPELAGKTLVSVAAATKGEQLCQWVGEGPQILTAIPNTAIANLASMTFVVPVRADKETTEKIKALFDTMGQTLVTDEAHLPAATALASCGIAYALRYVRAATEGGVQLGFRASEAQDIVAQTLRGAVSLLEKEGAHAEAEIDKVTTPGGLTIRGLNAMEEAGFTNAVIQGLLASLSK